MFYKEKYEEIKDITNLMLNNENKDAKNRIQKFILNNVNVNTGNGELLAHIVSTALMRRIDRDLLENINIYLQKFDIPQIVLFYKMAEAYPHVSQSHLIANQFILAKMNNLEDATILDIGIGKGKQLINLFTSITEKGYNIKTVNIVGLDPDEVNLEDSGKNFEELKDKLSFKINYYPVCKLLENYEDEDYEFIKKLGSENIFINAAYAFHHISHELNDLEGRTEVIKKLRALDPVLFTLTEPNSDHDTENISKRIHNTWNHFSTVYKLIDEAEINDEHKFIIKEKFFGREIRDIFGNSDFLRTERHESIDSWMFKLTRAGFIPFEYNDITIELPDHCEYEISEGLVELGYSSLPLVAVFAYQSAI